MFMKKYVHQCFLKNSQIPFRDNLHGFNHTHFSRGPGLRPTPIAGMTVVRK